MADIAVAATSKADTKQSPSRNVSAKKDKKVDRAKATHPTTAVMVTNAIQSLKERGGSSLQAIKKYISATYKVEGEKFAPFIKKYLKASVASGTLVQTKGKGASGSFKLASAAVTKKTATTTRGKKAATTTPNKPIVAKAASKTATTKTTTTTRTKKAAVGKTTKTSRRTPSVAAADTKISTTVAKSKSPPSKAKKTAKAPTKKPKSPKPKVTKKKVSPRKK